MGSAPILLDMETQADFFLPGGSCFNDKSLPAASNVYRLFEWARLNRMPVISTVLRVRPSGVGPLARVPHCREGSAGERKLAQTTLLRHIDLGLLNSTDLPEDLLEQYQQVIFEKRMPDIFAHSRLERLITELPPATFVICGAGLARGIAESAIGLRSRGFGVVLAEDAVLDLDDELAEMAALRMEAKGVIFAPTSKIVSPRVRRRAKGTFRLQHSCTK